MKEGLELFIKDTDDKITYTYFSNNLLTGGRLSFSEMLDILEDMYSKQKEDVKNTGAKIVDFGIDYTLFEHLIGSSDIDKNTKIDYILVGNENTFSFKKTTHPITKYKNISLNYGKPLIFKLYIDKLTGKITKVVVISKTGSLKQSVSDDEIIPILTEHFNRKFSGENTNEFYYKKQGTFSPAFTEHFETIPLNIFEKYKRFNNQQTPVKWE